MKRLIIIPRLMSDMMHSTSNMNSINVKKVLKIYIPFMIENNILLFFLNVEFLLLKYSVTTFSVLTLFIPISVVEA